MFIGLLTQHVRKPLRFHRHLRRLPFSRGVFRRPTFACRTCTRAAEVLPRRARERICEGTAARQYGGSCSMPRRRSLRFSSARIYFSTCYFIIPTPTSAPAPTHYSYSHSLLLLLILRPTLTPTPTTTTTIITTPYYSYYYY